MEELPHYEISEIIEHPFFNREIGRWRHRPRRPAFILRKSGCLEWDGAVNSKGYSSDGNGLIHRQAWSALVGPIPPDHHIHHICKNKRCAMHLACLSEAEHNALERRAPKLDEWSVRRILELLADGVAVVDVAKQFGVNKSHISKIASGKRWPDVWRKFHAARNGSRLEGAEAA